MLKYRELGQNEIVPKGAEVLQHSPNFEEDYQRVVEKTFVRQLIAVGLVDEEFVRKLGRESLEKKGMIYCDIPSEENDRIQNKWTDDHDYFGETVKSCVTRNHDKPRQRIFRILVDDVKE
jgi:hypothetical protein